MEILISICSQSYVVSSGVVNPTAVYSAVEQNKIKAKLKHKTVLFIPKKVAALANSTSTATKTWHFKLKKC
jgi:hypothetical protein